MEVLWLPGRLPAPCDCRRRLLGCAATRWLFSESHRTHHCCLALLAPFVNARSQCSTFPEVLIFFLKGRLTVSSSLTCPSLPGLASRPASPPASLLPYRLLVTMRLKTCDLTYHHADRLCFRRPACAAQQARHLL